MLQSHEAALGLLGRLADAYRRLNLYDCHGVIDQLEELPQRHLRSGWSLCLMGKAFIELADYRAVRRGSPPGRDEMCVLEINGEWEKREYCVCVKKRGAGE